MDPFWQRAVSAEWYLLRLKNRYLADDRQDEEHLQIANSIVENANEYYSEIII